MTSINYPIITSADEFTRLDIQADLFRDDARAMLARIGDGSGRRVLDLCCGTGGITDVLSDWVGPAGTVIGADLDTAKLAHARERVAESGASNIEFVEDNAFDSSLPAASFDLVHSRFAISVIRDGLGILDHLVTLVRPGGVVFLEEANTHSMECHPSTPEWERGVALMKETFRAVGADTTLGARLRGHLLDKGLTDIEVQPCLHALTRENPMHTHMPLTLAAMRDPIVSLGLCPSGKLDDLLAAIFAHLAEPETMTLSFTMMQFVARRPV